MFLCVLILVAGFAVPARGETENRLLVTHLVWCNDTNESLSSAIEAINVSVREDIAYYGAHGIPVIVVDKIYTDAVEAFIFQVGEFDKQPPPIRANLLPLPREQ